jgi:starch synthase
MVETAERPLRIALVASEVAPFAKTGGLADVTAALARALSRAGHDVRVFLPGYANLRELPGTPETVLAPWRLEFGGRSVAVAVRAVPFPAARSAAKPAKGGARRSPPAAPPPASPTPAGRPLRLELIDAPELYHRAGYYTEDADEPLRWAALSRAVIEACQRTGWAPDVIHCNDWHTGLLPLYLRSWYAWDRLFSGTRTLLALHNLGYQGAFPAAVVDQLGLGEVRSLFHQEHLNEGRVSFLETGVIHASWLATVSETYAREIQGAEHGMGLDGLLRERSDHLVGIVNGVDYDEWDPERDALIPARYSATRLEGKRRCRDALLAKFELTPVVDPGPPVIGIVSRMTAQKGFDLLPDILPVFLKKHDLRLVVLGSGEERYERYFQWLRDTFPERVACYAGYQEELAHWIEAGADLFLMPSRYEPCGLNQMYSSRYGTVPIVRATGGLADTVERWDPDQRRGTGFVFYDFNADALFHTIEHALDVWRDRDAWSRLVQAGMARDFSWERQARRYVELYRKMLEG